MRILFRSIWYCLIPSLNNSKIAAAYRSISISLGLESFLNKKIISLSVISFMHKIFSINLFPVIWIFKSSKSFLLYWYLSTLIEVPMALIKLFFLEPIPSNLLNVFEMIWFLIFFNSLWKASKSLVFISAISIIIQSAVYIHKLWYCSLFIKESAILGFKFNILLFTWITFLLCTYFA